MQDREIFLISGLLMITVALFTFFSSVHAIDLSYNVIKLTKAYNLPDVVDYTAGGYFVTYEKAYVDAMGMLIRSIFLLMAGSACFGYGLHDLPDKKSGKKSGYFRSDSYKKDKNKIKQGHFE